MTTQTQEPRLHGCGCEETKIKDTGRCEVLPWSPYHNCEYAKARAAMVPEAEAIAIMEATNKYGWEDNKIFNHAFTREMQRLTKDL